MKRFIFLFLSALILFTSASASKLSRQVGKVKDGYNFWLAEPDSISDDEEKPLVIFLHGASLCGNDLNKVQRYGSIDAINRGREIDAYVVAPQNPGGAWKPSKVMNIVDWVLDRYNIDEDRIYVLGMSLGGYGTIDVAATYPDRIAAAMALCGGGTVKDYSGLNDVPMWIVHGTADAAVSISQSDKVVAAMKDADKDTPRLRYDRMPGMNHSQPARMFYLKETYDWLFAHSLADRRREMNIKKTFLPSQEILGSAYKDLHGKRHASK